QQRVIHDGADIRRKKNGGHPDPRALVRTAASRDHADQVAPAGRDQVHPHQPIAHRRIDGAVGVLRTHGALVLTFDILLIQAELPERRGLKVGERELTAVLADALQRVASEEAHGCLMGVYRMGSLGAPPLVCVYWGDRPGYPSSLETRSWSLLRLPVARSPR